MTGLTGWKWDLMVLAIEENGRIGEGVGVYGSVDERATH